MFSEFESQAPHQLNVEGPIMKLLHCVNKKKSVIILSFLLSTKIKFSVGKYWFKFLKSLLQSKNLGLLILFLIKSIDLYIYSIVSLTKLSDLIRDILLYLLIKQTKIKLDNFHK